MNKGIFDKMFTDTYKRAFVKRKESQIGLSSDYKEKLRTYIFSDKCTNDILRLKNGDYFLDYPTQLFVTKNFSKKIRKVFNFKQDDKFILKYIAFTLMDFDNIHVDSLCSFRKDNRTKMLFEKISRVDPNRNLFVMKTDISDFGGSVDQDILLQIIKPFFNNDPEFYNFVSWIMTRNKFYRNNNLVSERVSIVEGLPIGPFLQNLYLRELDKKLEPESIIYMRYTDDIAFFTDSPEKQQWALEQVRECCVPLKIAVNEKKTVLAQPGEEVELLGIQICDGGFDIGTESIQKQLLKLKTYRDKYLDKERKNKCDKELAMKKMIKLIDTAFFGRKINNNDFNWVGHIFSVITRTNGLKQIDSFSQDCIRVVGSGKLGNAKYRIRYNNMVQAGYRNLLHAYYHGYSREEDIR